MASEMTAAADKDILDDEEFVKMWMMGMNTERTVGRPKDWDGKENGFDSFAFKFSNWLAAPPGDTEGLLEFVNTHTARRLNGSRSDADRRLWPRASRRR